MVLVEILVIVVSTPIVVVVLLVLILLMLVLLLRLALLLELRLSTLILLGLGRLLSWCGCSSVGLLGRRLSGSLRILALSRILIQLDQVLKVQLLLIILVFVRVVG